MKVPIFPQKQKSDSNEGTIPSLESENNSSNEGASLSLESEDQDSNDRASPSTELEKMTLMKGSSLPKIRKQEIK